MVPASTACPSPRRASSRRCAPPGGLPMLRDHPTGSYRFLPGISAFSSGVIAMPGHEIVHATLGTPLPWRDGFALVERHLRAQGRTRTALCGIELRSPKPFTFDGFAKFNEGYRALLGEWGILVGDDNPIPRTNVAPVFVPPGEPSLYAFAYTVPGATPAPTFPTFVVAGDGRRVRTPACRLPAWTAPCTSVRRHKSRWRGVHERGADPRVFVPGPGDGAGRRAGLSNRAPVRAERGAEGRVGGVPRANGG